MIQTYQPDHYAVIHAAAQNYGGFYKEEIIYREMMGYPPAAHMLAVQIFARVQDRGQALADSLASVTRLAFLHFLFQQILYLYQFIIFCAFHIEDKSKNIINSADGRICWTPCMNPTAWAWRRLRWGC